MADLVEVKLPKEGSSDSELPAGGNELNVHDEFSHPRPDHSPSGEPSEERGCSCSNMCGSRKQSTKSVLSV
jgi:hypothetical protein